MKVRYANLMLFSLALAICLPIQMANAQALGILEQIAKMPFKYGGKGVPSVGPPPMSQWERGEKGIPIVPTEWLESQKPREVSIPFSVATQNTLLRPDNLDYAIPRVLEGAIDLLDYFDILDIHLISETTTKEITSDQLYNRFVFNTESDNFERAEIIKKRISRYDIVALQEMFDPDQDRQFKNLRTHTVYNGSGRDKFSFVPYGWSSGLANLVGKRVRVVETSHDEFSKEGGGIDMFANKGYLLQKIQLGSNKEHYVHVLNTHLHADEPETRRAQLKEIANRIKGLDRNPVIFLGDFNVSAEDEIKPMARRLNKGGWLGGYKIPDTWEYYEKGPLDYSQMLRILGMPEDPIREEHNSTGRDFDTTNRNRNPYKYFFGEHHGKLARQQILKRPGRSLRRYPIKLPGSFESGRNDYILIRQGKNFQVRIKSLELIDGTDASRNAVEPGLIRQMRVNSVPGELFGKGKLTAFYSDHFGLAADLVFEKAK